MSRLECGYEHLATKADVESVRVDLERLRADMTAEIGGVMAELKAEIRDSKVSTILWLTGLWRWWRRRKSERWWRCSGRWSRNTA